MASGHWKDRREKLDFLERLREFRDSAVWEDIRDLVADDIEEMYWQDVRDGLFEDDPYDDWYDDEPYDDEPERYHKSPFEDCEPDYLADEACLARPGNHVRDSDGRTWLVLDNGKWADMLTGRTKSVWRGWVHKDQIIFE